MGWAFSWSVGDKGYMQKFVAETYGKRSFERSL
jgi:hypothetical protein